MLRLTEPQPGGRLGGWALIESPPQRTASMDQQWSLAIALAAALVAIAAVVFNLRLPSEASLPAVLPPPNVESTQRTVAATIPPPTAASPSDARTGATADTSSSTRATPASGASQPAATAAGSGAATASEPTASAGTTVGAAAAVTGVAESAAAPADPAAGEAIADPAARIRQYLGLHAGAQLPVSFSYAVEPGDTASSIAARFGLAEATVLFNNFDIYDPDQLTVGQLLQLPPVDGLVYTVQSGDGLFALLENYQADLEATLAYPANGISSPDQIEAGQQLLLVHGSASLAATGGSAAASGGGATAATWTEPTFLWPVGGKVGDLFGVWRPNAVGYHTGVDFIAPVGELVGASAGGVVTVATWDPSYGNWVEIDHGGGYRSRYAHLDIINVHEGQWVGANDYIGTVGNTGYSSGAHLHFEIIINGQAVNPLAWLN